MAHIASRTGMPIMRSLNLMFPDDPECENCMQQYMFGDFFLVGAFTDKIYLPEGRWIDFWTGQVYEGKQEIACSVPEDRGGPLFIRSGAIIPHWPDMDYVGQKPVDTIDLHVYPEEGTSSFTLYEDDGISYDYLAGSVAVTEITCQTTAETITLTIPARSGSYEGMPEKRSYNMHIHSDVAPKSIELNAVPLASSDWSYDEDAGEIRITASEKPDRSESVVILCAY
jgi:alpha-glucosidase (family GH31 glycosyl hydrolase)